ncbi:hypothetical protein HDU97_010199 [Phlyctochytrium planicorne]|nr:hypothetical protein HDU97_010199 [Phlyctochytrium planicorne]
MPPSNDPSQPLLSPDTTASSAPHVDPESNIAREPSSQQKLSVSTIIRLFFVNLILLTIFSIILSEAVKPLGAFLFHPLGVAILLIGTSNGIVLQQNPLTRKRNDAVAYHFYFQIAAVCGITLAYVALFFKQERNDSPHGKFGFFVIIFLWCLSLFGIKIFRYPKDIIYTRKRLYLIHRTIGYFLYAMVVATASFALFGKWASGRFPLEVRAGFVGGFVVVWGIVMAGVVGKRKRVGVIVQD